ncbi:MAG: hypothetical protein AVO38_08280 [delta proteobacterium ML8_D]|nr:MAG: hypothetical protein AVO38_08280 [delta proteobacterium ML8_D]
MKLTKAEIESAKLPEKGQKILWDSELKGLGVRLTPGTRTYIVQARVNGKSRRVSLGRHGVITLQQARKKAQKELVKMLEGKDPVIEKKRAEAYSLTLREITNDYLNDRRNMKASSKKDVLKHLHRAFSSWADKPAIEITRDKVKTRFRELTDRGPAQANQAFRNLRAILNYARAAYRPDDKPILVENPVSVLSDTTLWNRVKPRSGRIPTEKIGIAWNTLQDIRKSPGETVIAHTAADLLSCLLLSGARWGEMSSLTWEQVNLEDGWWFLPDPKNRNPVTFPLSQVAVEILKKRLNKNQKYIFPERSGPGHIKEARRTFEKVSEAIDVRVTAHDFRRTFRAIAHECKIDFYSTKLLMGHKISKDVMVKHYTETEDLRYLRPEIDKIGDWIVRQGFIAQSDNVVPFPSKAAGGKP